ncbi:MAG: PocR ligand-binding domain-containing protein [Acidobacteriota bacterium]
MSAAGASSLRELINVQHVQVVLELFYRVAGIPVQIVDTAGVVLVTAGPPGICAQFHRRHSILAGQCRRKAGGAGSVPYRCASGLWDWAAPIVIEGRRAGAVCFGPFLMADGRLDLDFYRRQARECGFDVDAYLAALASLPILSREKVDALTGYYTSVVGFLAALGRETLRRAESEYALRASEHHYRTLVEAMPDLMFRVSAGRMIVDFHAPKDACLLMPHEAVVGTRLADIPFPLEVAAEVLATVEKAFATGQSQRVEYAVPGPAGIAHYEARVEPADEEVVVIVRDVSARKEQEQELWRALEALRQSETRFRLLVQAAGEGIGVIDDQERFTLVNPAAEAILRVESGSLTGRSLGEFVTPEQFQMVREQSEKRRQGEKSTYELEIQRPNGERRTIIVTATQFLAPGGSVASLGVFRDITQAKRATEERLRASRLESAATLAGGIAHEVNNQMTVVLGHSELVREKLGDRSEVSGSLTAVSNAALEASSLAQRLLDYVQGGLRQPRVVNLNTTVLEALEAHAEIKPPGVGIKCVLDPMLWRVEADPAQMAQVAGQLYRNAAEAIASEGRVVIQTSNLALDGDMPPQYSGLKPGHYVSLSVDDTGCGMDAATLARVFEPFFTTKFLGRGLGLAAAHGIVKRHGGLILASSEKGAGSRFEVCLPALEPSDAGR